MRKHGIEERPPQVDKIVCYAADGVNGKSPRNERLNWGKKANELFST